MTIKELLQKIANKKCDLSMDEIILLINHSRQIAIKNEVQWDGDYDEYEISVSFRIENLPITEDYIDYIYFSGLDVKFKLEEKPYYCSIMARNEDGKSCNFSLSYLEKSVRYRDIKRYTTYYCVDHFSQTVANKLTPEVRELLDKVRSIMNNASIIQKEASIEYLKGDWVLDY